MLKQLSFLALVIGMLSATYGCAVNRATASLTPGMDLGKPKIFYVVQWNDDTETGDMIKANLVNRGYTVKIGPALQPPYQADVVVTYVSKWMWDITMYMLELTINFRDPTNNFPIAVGNSFHTSLTRKSPEEMVNEVLTNIFSAK